MQRRSVLITFLLAFFAPFIRLFKRQPKADHLVLGDVQDFDFDRTEPFSVSCWVKTKPAPPQLTEKPTHPEGFRFFVTEDGNLRFNEQRIKVAHADLNDGGSTTKIDVDGKPV